MSRLFQTFFDALYGLYALLVFLVSSIATCLLVIAVPGLSIAARRAIAHAGARAFFWFAGIRVSMRGQALPAGPCVVVANHASYIDGVLLKAFLPARFSFVIKKEITKIPVAGLLLRRIGSEFVDRFNRNAGAVDARRLIKAADSGQALAFFPEGTFNLEPGLGKFHTGAFVIAARAGMPIVPIAIHGTRYMLPQGRFLPRLCRLRVEILPEVGSDQSLEANAAARDMRDRSRTAILRVLAEPDLAESDGIAAMQAARKS